jgi:hypothetical protein
MRSVALVLLVLASACGPIGYINQVTRRASSHVAAAEAAGGEKYAPYEYTTAVLYLHKAREEEGYAHHQAAVRFGKKAEDMARKAREIALERAGLEPQGSEAPIDPGENLAGPSEDR